ncbi:exodeoxyribonuclease III [uncultured Muriicola sp.]|uniref:exodeoxyribonuclease III n=1 Tax=uncultured Muriicola sp. TaxID=1583102 RepID=UPI002616654B|nr:exodeoxyribonuclease III [uncultured Muriicola sp.]
MKIVSYNVNGIRAAVNKGFLDWLQSVDPDVVCLQEIKAMKEQLDLWLFEEAGYPYHYWYSAEKKGYSGVAILSKKEPDHIEFGTGIDYMDFEGRNLRADFDYNICHQAIDIHDPVRNKNVSGFLPVEREWIGNFMESGFIDSFRHFNQEPHQYTWWSYRANARNNNKGWRLDYGMVSRPLEDQLKRSVILSKAKHSDHCPILVELEST